MKTKTICCVFLMLQMIVLSGISGNILPLSSPHHPGDFQLTTPDNFQTADHLLQSDNYLSEAEVDEPMEPALSGNGLMVHTSSPGGNMASRIAVTRLAFNSGITPDPEFTPGTAMTSFFAGRNTLYQNGFYTELPLFRGIHVMVNENPLTGPGDDLLPLPYLVTGGGTYCQGSQGMPAGLEYSQSGVVYELFRNGITTNLSLTGNDGPLDFGLQPDGVYTITGTNEYGTTPMSGSITIEEAPLPIVSISSDQEIYCHGSNATFTANLDFSGGVTYQWYRNNAPVGSNSPTLTLWAVDGDNIQLRVTSEQGCAALSNTVNLEVFINYASVYFDFYEPVQLVAGEEITLSAYTFNAGINPTFEWFVNDIQVPGNDCQLTYTPGPADEIYVRMIPGEEVPCLLDVYYSNTVIIYTCTGPPQAFDVWSETNTCGGEFFSFGLSGTETGVKYYLLTEFEGLFYQTPYEFFGTGNAVEEYGFQSGDYYYLAVNACDSTWMNGHADLYPFDTRATVTVSDNNICNGEGVVFTAKSNQPETVTCTYNWAINGYWEWNPKPEDFSYTPGNGDIVTAYMATPCFHDDLHFPDNNSILMMVNDCPGISTTWNGNISENWHDQNNWNNGVPGTNTVAVIPGGRPHYPTITGIVRCKSIVIEHGGSFIGGEFLEAPSALVKCNFSDAEFHFLSSPVNPAPLFGEVFPDKQNSIWARRYDERSGEWINLTSYNQFGKATGYSMQLTQPNTAQFIGKLNGENALTSIENYNTSGLVDRAGWNLLGNPFPSSIDWDLVPHNNIENAVYVWDGIQYISWNGMAGALENGIIPPMNGFFVKKNTDYWNSFVIPASSRVHGNVPYYKENPADLLKIEVTGNNYTDVTFVRFNQDATSGFDPEYDAWKLRGIEEAPQLFSYAEGKELSINEQPFVPGGIIELGFKCKDSGNFSLNVKGLESFLNNVRILLEDVKEGILQNLSDNMQYSFSYIAGESEQRFKLHFTEMSSNSGPAEINIYCIGKTLMVNNFTGLTGEIRVFDFTGRMILNRTLDGGDQNSFTPDVAVGPYVVKVLTAKGVYSRKVVLM